MASLTDTLQEPNYTPQAIGGARQTTFFEGAASAGADILRTMGNSANRGRSGTSADDNPVLDEEAMNIFETKTGLKLGDPGYDEIVYAQRLQRAKENGTLSATAYDIKMQGQIASLIRKNPTNAREIMADAYNLHGIKDEIFREAAWADKEANAVVDRNIKAKGAILDEAVKTGLYDPRIHTEDYGMEKGMEWLKTQADFAADKALYESQKARFEAGDAAAQAAMKETQGRMSRRYFTTADQAFGTSLATMQYLMTSAGTDVERNNMLDQEFIKMQQGLMLLEQNGAALINSFESSFVDKNGITRYVAFDDKVKEQWRTWVADRKNMITTLMGMDAEGRKRFIDRYVTDNKIQAIKSMPVFMGMKDNVFGGSMTAMMDFIANGPETLGVDPQIVQQLADSIASGLDQYTNTSLQAIKEMTIAGALPSSNPNAKVSEAAFQTNLGLAKLYGGALKQGRFGSPKDQQYATESFRNSMEDVVYAIRANYTPNMIDVSKVDRGLSVLFNEGTLANIDAFIKMGGSKEDADQFYTHSAIAATTFLDGLKGRYKIEYNKALKRFEGVPTQAMSVGSLSAGSQAGSAYPAMSVNREDQDAADRANKLLEFIDANDKRKPVIEPALLKEGGVTLRDVVSSQEGLAAGLKVLTARAKAKADASGDAAFAKSVDSFTDETKGRIGGMTTNPFNLSDLNMTGGASGNPFDSEEAWATYRDELRGDESGGSTTAVPMNKDGSRASSAFGVDQFIKGTWLKFAKDEPWAQGLSEEQILAKRADPNISEDILKEFTYENAKALRQSLGTEPTGAMLRVAHFSGSAGAITALKADPDIPVNVVLKAANGLKEGDVNYNVFYKKDGKPKTVKEFLSYFGVK